MIERRRTAGGVDVGPRGAPDGLSYDERNLPVAVLEPPVKADTNDRRTPGWFVAQCRNRFGAFDLDAAASADNRVCRHWCGVGSDFAEDGLTADWGRLVMTGVGNVWLNPPYGPAGTIEKWIAKAREQRDRWDLRTLLLLPADTSTRWFHDVSRTELIELVPFRLAFEAPDGSTEGNSAKFGSVLVWIAPKIQKPAKGSR